MKTLFLMLALTAISQTNPTTQTASINQPPSTLLLISNLTTLQPTVGVAFSYQMIASFYTQGPFTWTATGLPPGLTMSTDGLISGIPTQAGAYVVPIVVTVAPTLWGDGSSTLYTDAEAAWLRIQVQ